MFVLTCDIKIGNKRITSVNEVVVKRSIYTLGDTATIKLPVTAILKQAGEPAVKVETAQQIKVGDKVKIMLGYNNRLNREFVGWVKRINLRTPVEIECEDDFWTCRSRSIKTSGTIALEQLLKKCGLNVGFAETLTLKNFVVPDKPVSSVLSNLVKEYGLVIFFDLDGKVYASRPEKITSKTVKYKLRHNVINDDNLQFQKNEDLKIQIKAICIKKDGNKVEAKKGIEGGVVRTRYFYDVTDMNELATLAQYELDKENSNGYAGSITTFLEPYAAPTMTAQIEDDVYSDRNGKYYIEGVETTFGQSGARRKIEIGTSL